MDLSRRLPIPFSHGAAAADVTGAGLPGGRPPDPLVWLDRDMTYQLLETIGAASGRRAVAKAVHAWQTIEREAPGDIALGEHLAAGLDHRERYVVIHRTLRGEGRERSATALGIDPGVIVDVEHSACLKAATLTCRYHDNLICEPAELAVAVGQTQREEAVAGHLSSCSRCGPEFAARVANVLHHAARFMTENAELLAQDPGQLPTQR
jgi:hypothetical protein